MSSLSNTNISFGSEKTSSSAKSRNHIFLSVDVQQHSAHHQLQSPPTPNSQSRQQNAPLRFPRDKLREQLKSSTNEQSFHDIGRSGTAVNILSRDATTTPSSNSYRRPPQTPAQSLPSRNTPTASGGAPITSRNAFLATGGSKFTVGPASPATSNSGRAFQRMMTHTSSTTTSPPHTNHSGGAAVLVTSLAVGGGMAGLNAIPKDDHRRMSMGDAFGDDVVVGEGSSLLSLPSANIMVQLLRDSPPNSDDDDDDVDDFFTVFSDGRSSSTSTAGGGRGGGLDHFQSPLHIGQGVGGDQKLLETTTTTTSSPSATQSNQSIQHPLSKGTSSSASSSSRATLRTAAKVVVLDSNDVHRVSHDDSEDPMGRNISNSPFKSRSSTTSTQQQQQQLHRLRSFDSVSLTTGETSVSYKAVAFGGVGRGEHSNLPAVSMDLAKSVVDHRRRQQQQQQSPTHPLTRRSPTAPQSPMSPHGGGSSRRSPTAPQSPMSPHGGGSSMRRVTQNCATHDAVGGGGETMLESLDASVSTTTLQYHSRSNNLGGLLSRHTTQVPSSLATTTATFFLTSEAASPPIRVTVDDDDDDDDLVDTTEDADTSGSECFSACNGPRAPPPQPQRCAPTTAAMATTASFATPRARAIQRRAQERAEREHMLLKSRERQTNAVERKMFLAEHRTLQLSASWLTFVELSRFAMRLNAAAEFARMLRQRRARRGVAPLVVLRLRQALRRARTRIQGRGAPRPAIAALRADKLLNLFPDAQLQYAIDRMTLKYFFENENIIMMGSEDDEAYVLHSGVADVLMGQ
ncbi:Hypothetical protein, putative, partial [Bodo saltans]